METSHTATPYLTNGREIFTSDGQVVARMEEIIMGTPFAGCHNAAFIVRACNAHDDLVKALQSAAESIEMLVKLNRIPANNSGLRDARAALAKAEESC